MGYQVYEDRDARYRGVERWAGYGVPAVCDYPDCTTKIDRGLAYKCEGDLMYADDEDEDDEGTRGDACGLYFCTEHSPHSLHGEDVTPKPDTPQWINHLLTDDSWWAWRCFNPQKFRALSVMACPGCGHTVHLDLMDDWHNDADGFTCEPPTTTHAQHIVGRDEP